MGYSRDTKIDQAMEVASRVAGALLHAAVAAEEGYNQLLEAKDGDNSRTWAQRLHQLPTVGPSKLKIDGDARTISCIAGAQLFKSFTPGKKVTVAGFLDPANTFEYGLVTAVTPDSIEVDVALVTENGTGIEVVVVEASPDEIARVDAMVEAGVSMHSCWEALDADALRAISSIGNRGLHS